MSKVKEMKVAIIDYGLSNSNSVLNMIKWIGADGIITSDSKEIQEATHLILPGVGAFDSGMENLRKSNLIDVLSEEVLIKKKPILGICLGMQLLLDSSEEGNTKGLGWIDGYSRKFVFETNDLKIPHMGWNEIFVQNNTALFDSLDKDFYLYFVHSYHAVCEDKYAIGKTHYGYEFVSAVQNGNIYGIQPHPEKSHENGLKIIENFAKL